mmetsp:Transcript_57238/g.100225  ORF Transcript_57238/g.100225 Transcript_57238/m.100225 type:complete len:106 (-) Transcript_57238:2065-2382(-)
MVVFALLAQPAISAKIMDASLVMRVRQAGSAISQEVLNVQNVPQEPQRKKENLSAMIVSLEPSPVRLERRSANCVAEGSSNLKTGAQGASRAPMEPLRLSQAQNQ